MNKTYAGVVLQGGKSVYKKYYGRECLSVFFHNRGCSPAESDTEGCRTIHQLKKQRSYEKDVHVMLESCLDTSLMNMFKS